MPWVSWLAVTPWPEAGHRSKWPSPSFGLPLVFGNQPERLRLSVDQDNLEYYKVEQADVYDTLSYLYGGTTVGYSHRGGGRLPIPIRIALSKTNGQVDQRALTTPVPS